jgi:hypothetical protein
MEIKSFDDVKNGLMFYLLGSDKPIIESLQPNPVNQEQALLLWRHGTANVLDRAVGFFSMNIRILCLK